MSLDYLWHTHSTFFSSDIQYGNDTQVLGELLMHLKAIYNLIRVINKFFNDHGVIFNHLSDFHFRESTMVECVLYQSINGGPKIL